MNVTNFEISNVTIECTSKEAQLISFSGYSKDKSLNISIK